MRSLLAALMLLVVVGCKESGTGPTPPAAVASVTLDANAATLDVGATVTLIATARDAAGAALTNRSISWNSSAPTIASVTGGVITAVSGGVAQITATSEGKSATATINVSAPPLSCDASTPTGRLTTRAEGGYTYVTKSGEWNVRLVGLTLTITHPGRGFKSEHWGMQSHGGPELPLVHENLNGKHIKDMLGTQRTELLTDGTIITINAAFGAAQASVSIYDADQTHRLIATENNVTIQRSCLIGRFGEAEEYDGETTGFVFDGTITWWRRLYNQGVSAQGVPLQKIPDPMDYGEVDTANPHNVRDWYDAPRWPHT